MRQQVLVWGAMLLVSHYSFIHIAVRKSNWQGENLLRECEASTSGAGLRRCGQTPPQRKHQEADGPLADVSQLNQ